MKNIILANNNFKEIKNKILNDGKEKIHIVADFDKTLTRAFVNGESTPSIISSLRKRGILSEDYTKQSKELFETYHPIELDHTIESHIRDAKMNEWWTKIFELLIKEKLNKSHLEEVIKSGDVELREGVAEFLVFLRDHKIPIIILSASGIGDLIPMYLESKGLLYHNITIVSNFFKWDEEGFARFPIPPIVHSENKGEISLEKFHIYEELLKRPNVLVLGDSLGDSEIYSKFPTENILRFGFLNEKIEERLNEYKKRFDCLITHDSDFKFINEFFNQ